MTKQFENMFKLIQKFLYTSVFTIDKKYNTRIDNCKLIGNLFPDEKSFIDFCHITLSKF